LRDGEFPLRRTEEIVSVLGGVCDHQRLRIGKSNVLDCHAHDATRYIEWRLTGVEHAAEIIKRCVRIGATH
jgi:hypothetical protein